MFDPREATKFDRTDAELQEFAVFAVCVTGKTAKMIARQVHELLAPHQGTPFEIILGLAENGVLETELRRARLGQYGRLNRALPQLAHLDLRSCTLHDLEAVFGVGPKTARYILLHNRPGIELVPLDTHILQYLRSIGYDTPKSTPTSRSRYAQLEAAFIAEAKKQDKTVAQFDLEVWNSRSRI